MIEFTMNEFADSAKYSANASKRNAQGRGAVITCRIRKGSRDYLRYYAKKYATTTSTYLDMVLNRIASEDEEFLASISEDAPTMVDQQWVDDTPIVCDEDGTEIVEEDELEF